MGEGLRRGLPVAAALLALVAVAMDALAAHALTGAAEPRAAELVATGSRHQLAHALAILVAGALRPERLAARLAFLAGAVLFPGALYGLALGLPRGLAAVAPLGGGLLLLGWALLARDLARPRSAAAGDPRPR
jgi:uncharacterized membrane protein YgdD (TMEM256/DUF423 family)